MWKTLTKIIHLPATAEIVKLFVSSLRHLVLDIDISLCGTFSNLAEVDFSPRSLGSRFSVDPTDILLSTLTLAQLMSSLADYIIRSIKEGILIIHSEKTAPG